MSDPMPETRETVTEISVTVRCERCAGTGKDPQLASGGIGAEGFWHEPWPCSMQHNGCGGSGQRSAVIVGVDRATYLLGKLALAVPNATEAELAAGRAALSAFDAAQEGDKDG